MGELHRFTVHDVEAMAAAGILNEDSRVELIRGRIIDMAAIGVPHMMAVLRLTRLFVTAVGDRGVVSVQNPVRLDDFSEPQPDVVVLKPGADARGATLPRPADVLLMIEVADSTLADDRAEKASLYAESGIADYWIVNCVDETVEVHRNPQDGGYREVRRDCRDGDLQPLLLPGVLVSVADIFGLTRS
ncbi:MAG: Uma2 family endonuclease [Acidisphaera sp.]|nr:Uma2 family endonuclease [Acidisphaera sp.]